MRFWIGVTTDLFREEKDENNHTITLLFYVIREMILLGEYIMCFKTNSKSDWLCLYWFAAYNSCQHQLYFKLRMLGLSVLYFLFVFQDTVIYDRLAETSKYKEITLKHLEQFATEGECNMQ